MLNISKVLIFSFLCFISLNLHAEEFSTMQNASSQILMLVIFIAIFYFLIWRPQSKRNKEHKELIDNLLKGDEIVTTGGILGKIIKVDKNFVTLEVSPQNNIKIQKQSVMQAIPKGTINSL